MHTRHPPACDCETLLHSLRASADPARLAGMARFGIDTSRALGVQIPQLRRLASAAGKGLPEPRRHCLALDLWASGIHEARILASMLDVPPLVTEDQMDSWAADFGSWDLCDQCCNNLFRKTQHAWAKAQEWGAQGVDAPEFTVRAGFVLMAVLAVHAKAASDNDFEPFWPLLHAGSADSRTFVKKAVSWALRQLGKRNAALHGRAVQLAREMLEAGSPAARWVARDVLRELQGPKVATRLGLD